jgi:hypothetical protein
MMTLCFMPLSIALWSCTKYKKEFQRNIPNLSDIFIVGEKPEIPATLK